MTIEKFQFNKYYTLGFQIHTDNVTFELENSYKYHVTYYTRVGSTAFIDALTKTVFQTLGVVNSSKDLNPKDLGKTFISKSAVLPRYKLKSLKDDHGLSIVRDVSKADSIIISKDEMEQIFDCSYHRQYYRKETLLTFLRGITLPMVRNSYRSNLTWYTRKLVSHINADRYYEIVQSLIERIESMPSDVPIVKLTTQSNFFDIVDDTHELKEEADFESWAYTVPVSDFNQTVESYKGKKIYTDNAIESLLGSGAIDHESYDMINKLFESRDAGNVDLAFTMMANSNFETSMPYLMLLMDSWYNVYRDKPYVKSVAFKSLLKYMNYNKYSHYNIDAILTFADNHGVLTDELKQLMTKKYSEEMSGLLTRYKWFKVTNIELRRPDDTDKGRD
jgi:hypothetical protein